MVRQLKRKYKASILEPLIAMVIVLISLSASFVVVLKIRQEVNVQQRTRAAIVCARVMHNSVAENEFLNEESEEEGLTVENEIEWHDKANNLLLISVRVLDNKGKELVQRRKVIIYDEDSKGK